MCWSVIGCLILQVTDWLLCEETSQQMSNGRALCQGHIWTEDGKLAATVKQEGIIRGKL